MSISFWHRWILAGIFLLVEALTLGFIFLWLGISAGLTGFILLLVPRLVWQWQILAFTILTLASVLLWLRLRARAPAGEGAGLNRRAEACIGQHGVLKHPLVAGRHGRVRLGDTTWAATGPELPAGTHVCVVAADGTVLRVEPVADV